MTAPNDARPGTVVVHLDDDPTAPGARRLVARATTHGDWPWIRLTGPHVSVRRGSDLFAQGWRVQPLAELAEVLGE